MSSHPIDFITLGNGFGTPEMREIFSETNRLAQQDEVEKKLAEIQGKLKIIPQEAADDITRLANFEKLDINALAKAGTMLQHSLMPLLQALQAQCGAAGQFIHYGATTQDIVDTATMLQIQAAWKVLKRDLLALIKQLNQMAQRYRDVVMVGRTHGIQALPITFGFKLAIWLDELLRHWQRLEAMQARTFVGSLCGAVGSYAALGEQGPAVESELLKALGLGVPRISWQSARDRLAEIASVGAMLSASLGKIGNELYNLMRSEIAEVEENFSHGKVGSSTMPHKRNPALIESLASLTPAVLSSQNLIFNSMHVEHERDAMSWRCEWLGLPTLHIHLAAQLKLTIEILSNLKINEQQMRHNLSRYKGLLMSEKIMFELGKYVGKQRAHQVVYECSMQAFEQNCDFKTILLAQKEVASTISEQELESWLAPEQYLGCIGEKIDSVIAASESLLLQEQALIPETA